MGKRKNKGKLFKPKAGGSLVGNILRGVATSAAGVINPKLGELVGGGLSKVQEAIFMKSQMKENGSLTNDNDPVKYLAGEALGGAAGGIMSAANDSRPINSAFTDGLNDGVTKVVKEMTITDYLKKYGLVVIGVIVLLIVLITKKKK